MHRPPVSHMTNLKQCPWCFSQRSNLRRMSLDMAYMIDVVLGLPPQKNVVALDVDDATGYVYWSDTTQDKVSHVVLS